jgi:hypothetical protein
LRTKMSLKSFIEQGIKDGLAQGKPYATIGKELSPLVKQKFDVNISGEAIRGRVRETVKSRVRHRPDETPAIEPAAIIPAPVEPTGELTADEREKLKTLEGIIGREMGSFVAVGKALFTIRDTLLYREEFKTFPAYCTGKWGLGRHQAYNLIRGSQVAANLLTRVNTLHPCEIQPVHEKQVRPLSILEPDQQCEVWEEAVRSADGKVVTYKLVKALVVELVGPAPPTPPKQKDPYAHSDAHVYVSQAIIALEKIQDDDPLRVGALGRISEWIQEKLTIWTKN